ncbi:PKD domain-containing protein [Glutamicibacter ardleyensis]|uniref:PKD domain-containing protein n=1 Tax=Glutamicibacter ardleyensis TaxID=225894 RepID=UPI003FD0CCF0
MASTAMAIGLAGVTAIPAQASDQQLDTVVSANPAANTPHVLDGIVFSVAEVGDLIVLGGSFTTVQAASGGPILNRNRMVAFNKNTGAISANFTPNFNSSVRSVVAAADGNSVYVGGQFGTLNGASVPKVVKLNLSNGSRITQFNPGNVDAVVHDLNLQGNNLYFGGEFTEVRGQNRGGLAEVNATTGALSEDTKVEFTGQHFGGTTFVHKFDINADGTKLIASGNFTQIDGQDRVQVGMLDLSGQTTTVADWQTDRWKPMCYTAFAYYLNDLDFSVDGDYFVMSSMGGYGSGPPSLCDSISRWETSDTGNAINPVWVNYTGGDSVYAVEATGPTIYFGGHMRWVNNPFRADAAGQGAVEREGIGALSATNGMPIDWNPGRDRGRGVFDILATDQGVWFGSDTDRIARYVYKGRIAMFPVANGQTIPEAADIKLPVDVLRAGELGGPTDPRYLYRLNAGGATIQSLDGGMNWLSDINAPGSDYRSDGSNAAAYPAVPTLNAAVPASTPRDIFSSERWDPSGGNTLDYAFPVPSGKNVQVRVYASDRCSCTTAAGSRVFDVNIEGQTAFDDVDLNADPGHDQGTVLTHDVVSDGTINLSFGHVTENPAINGIEIVDLDAQAPAEEDSVATEVYFSGTQAAVKGTTELNSNVDWDQVRGAFIGDNKAYLALADGSLQVRSYNGTTLGTGSTLELYGLANFSSEIQQMTGLFLSNDRMYFTLAGQDGLFMRYFDLSSQIVGSERFTVANSGSAGINFADIHGMFLADNTMYYATSDGKLHGVDWAQTTTNGAPSGASSVVSDPAENSVNWASKALLAMASNGAPPLPNQSPTASFTSECTDLGCAFDASGSTDSDGDIASYAWDFGDDSDGTDTTAEHTYAEAGTYTVTLSVTDDDGATATASDTVEVTAPPNQAPEAVIIQTCNQLDCSFDGTTSADPDGEISSWAWTSSDGASSSDSVFEHNFATAGTYQVELTVTDDQGETASTQVSVEVSLTPNEAPVAAFSSDCVFLSCTLDGSISSDADGTVTGYSWLIDGVEVATGVVATHPFTTAGTYQITLVVTDDSGETNELTQPVSVVEDPGPVPGNDVTFVDSAANSGTTNAQTHSVTLPSGIEQGDLLVAVLSVNSGSSALSTPDGWELRANATTASMSGAVYSKIAEAADAGSTVSVNAGAYVRGSLSVAGYRDATVQAASFAMQAQSGSSAQHSTPQMASQNSSWLLSYWADKTGSTTSWSVPDDTVARQTGAGTGGGHLSWLLADSDGPVGSSTAGGLVATADSATANAVMASVVLTAAPSGGNAAPVAAFSTECQFLVCVLDASDSSDPDGSLLEYEWSVDGTVVAQGVSITHDFSAAGTYEVSLKVTDTAGEVGTTEQSVVVEADSGPPPVSDVAFVDSSANDGTANSRTHSVGIPASVQAGDLLVAVFSTNQYSEAVSAPSGWEQRAQAQTASMQGAMFSRVATAVDAGGTVTFNSSVYARGSLVLSVYRDAQVSSASFIMEPETAASSSHTTPEASAMTGDWYLSYWSDKTSATTGWQIPSSQQTRETGAGTGGGHLSWMLADSGAAVSAGIVGGVEGNATSSTANAVMGTVVLSALN